MNALETVACRIIGQVFVDRIVWILVAEGEIIGSGISQDFLDLRWVQVRAGIVSVALVAESVFRDITRAECRRYSAEWHAADADERHLLENFFAQAGKRFADTRPEKTRAA